MSLAHLVQRNERGCLEVVVGQHAYLIIAHNDFSLLEKLLTLIDYEHNDIYLHVDKKSKNFEPNKVEKCINKSKLIFVDRLDVQWGGDSLVACELLLLQEATKKKYDYYHLLSGVDLPLKTQPYIHDYFRKNSGNEYIDFDAAAIETGSFLHRIMYWHLLQNKTGRKKGIIISALRVFERLSLKIQVFLKIDRTANGNMEFYKGAQWFSITHDLAVYVSEKRNLIRKYFYKSLCADEVFLHTIAMNSPFRDKIVDDSLRYIDWERGSPYTFTSQDFGILLSSNKLWARKFSTDKDETIIDEIYNHLLNTEN